MSSVDTKIALTLDQIRKLSALSDAASRKQAASLSRQLTLLLEPPEETALQITFMPLQLMSCRLAIGLNLFNLVAEHDSKIDAEALAAESSGEKLLIVRIMRVLALMGFVDEVGDETWAANSITKVMTNESVIGTHKTRFNTTLGSAVKAPEYMRQFGYKSPTDLRNGVLQHAFQTDQTSFEYWSSDPERLYDFNSMMTGIRHSRPSWLEWFPVSTRLLEDYRVETTLMVDVAGNWGRDLLAFQQRFATTEKLVLEDLPHVTSQAPRLPPNIKLINYDFFSGTQPVKGARVYFFHFILHDWPDDKCLEILRYTKEAMTPGYSKILLNEYVLRDQGCSMQHAMMDLNMLLVCSGLERTERQWRQLVAQAGLEVIKIWRPHGDEDGEGIVEIGL